MMKSNRKYWLYGILMLAFVTIIFISRYVQRQSVATCPACPNPGTWSECSEEAAKMRTNYKCGAETNYTCESYAEEKACVTELKIKGAMKGSDVVISPTLDENVKGIIKIEALIVPDRTTKVEFIFMPQDVQLGSQMTKEELAKLVREIDTSGADNWKVYFDTMKVENGLYKIFVGLTYEDAPNESPWLDYAQTQIVVKN